MFVRVRHACSVGAPETVFRVQLHTGFVKLFKIELNAKEMDASVRYRYFCAFTVVCRTA